jgi:polygalacturonase
MVKPPRTTNDLKPDTKFMQTTRFYIVTKAVRIAATHGVAVLLALSIIPSLAGDGASISPKPLKPKIPTRHVNLADFGKGDGVTLNTEAFEKAFVALAKKGGGKLIVPPGIWLTGPIKMRSHTELHVERGALIQFSGDYKLYPLTIINVRGEKDVDSTPPIFGQNLEDVAITGEGIIDGGGDAWRMIKKSKLTEGEWKALVKSGGVLNEKGDV